MRSWTAGVKVFTATCASSAVAVGAVGLAPVAQAANLGSYTADCLTGGSSSQTISGNVGDTFTIVPTGAMCYLASSSSGVVSWVTPVNSSNPSASNPGDNVTVTLRAAGSTTYTAQQNGGYSFTVNVASATSAASPAAGPPDVLQQFVESSLGLVSCDAQAGTVHDVAGVSPGGWGRSWAMWPHGGTGGFVCTRLISYSPSQQRYITRST